MISINCNYGDESQIIICDMKENDKLIQGLATKFWNKYINTSDIWPRITIWQYIENELSIKMDLSGHPQVVVIQCNSKEEALSFKLKYL